MGFIQRRKLKNYFYNILINMSIPIIGAILVLSVFLYVNFREFGLDIINKSNQKMLSQISYNVSSLNQYVITYGAALTNNPSVTQLMYSQDMTMMDTLSNIRALDNSMRSTPFVHSIYVFNGGLKRYYAIGPHADIRTEESFLDQEVVALLHDTTKLKSIGPIPRKIPINPYKKEELAEVYTYILTETGVNGTSIRNALIINVNVAWILNSFATENQGQMIEGGNILVLDRSGQIVGHSQKDEFLKDVSAENYVQNILQADRDTGYFIETIEGDKIVTVFESLENPDWKFVSIIPYQQVAKSITKVKNISMLIGFLVLAVGLFYSYVISKKLYSPIGMLRKNIDQLVGQTEAGEESMNEFDWIADHVSSTVDRMVSLATFKNRNMMLLKQEFLKSLFTHKVSKKELHSKFHELGVMLDVDKNFCSILFKLDHYQNFCIQYTEDVQSLYKFALTNIAAEVFNRQYPCESVVVEHDLILNILNIDNIDGECIKDLYQCIREIQNFYKNYNGVSFSAFFSTQSQSLDRINESFQELKILSAYRIAYGQGCILTKEMLRDEQTEKFDITSMNINELLDAIKSAKKDSFENALDKIFTKLYACDFDTIMFALSYIASSMFNMLAKIEQNSTVAFEIGYVHFYERITKQETLEQIRQEFNRLFDHILQKITKNKEEKFEHIVNNAIRYIQDNYSDQNLSQGLLADLFKISPTYLSKIFKEITATTMVDYIKETRLRKAKELLSATNYTIDEITEKIGWGNAKYFSTVFKQNFGVTPMEYRLKASTKEVDGGE